MLAKNQLGAGTAHLDRSQLRQKVLSREAVERVATQENLEDSQVTPYGKR
jgi:hypothetical protein